MVKVMCWMMKSWKPLLPRGLAYKSDSETTDDTNHGTHPEAKLHVLNLQHYFTQQGFNDEAHSLLDKCANLVDHKCATTLKQTSLQKINTIVSLKMYYTVLCMLHF